MRDQLYRDGPDRTRDLVDFAFDADVARVFPDMIRRSVPGYDLIVPMTGVFAGRHQTPASTAYDLGCSRGATLVAIERYGGGRARRLVGVDDAQAMIEQCRALTLPGATFRCEDVRRTDLSDAGFVALNFTLQFLPPEDRTPLLRRIHGALAGTARARAQASTADPAGALVVSEKVVRSDDALEARLRAEHEAFKRANGYSELEIAGKRAALEDVLVPDTPEALRTRLEQAGFREVVCWFQAFDFTSWLALP